MVSFNDLMHQEWLSNEFEVRPAEGTRLIAFDYFIKKDFRKTIVILDEALKYNDPKINPLIYELRAECYKELNQEKEYIDNLYNSKNSLQAIEPNNYSKISDLYSNAFRYYWDKGDLKNAEKYILKAEKIIKKSKTDNSSKSHVYVWLARLHKKLGNVSEAKIYKEKSLHNSKIKIIKKFNLKKDKKKPIFSKTNLKNNNEPLSYLFPNLLEFLKEEQSLSSDSKTEIIDINDKLELVTYYSEKSLHNEGIRITKDYEIILYVNDIKDNVIYETINIQILNDLERYFSLFNALELYLLEINNF